MMIAICYFIATNIIKCEDLHYPEEFPKSHFNKSNFFLFLTLVMSFLYCFLDFLSNVVVDHKIYAIANIYLLIYSLIMSLFLFYALIYFYLYFHSSRYNKAKYPKKSTEQPPVNILLPTCNEPKKLLIETVDCLLQLDYEMKNIYVIENSIDKNDIIDEALRNLNNVSVFSIKNRGSKAAALNDVLPNIDRNAKYTVIFDSDHKPHPNFLKDLIPYLEADNTIQYVQIPQSFNNSLQSPVALASAHLLATYYTHVCEGRAMLNCSPALGTNTIYRTDIIEKFRFCEETPTEDIDISFRIHAEGGKSLFISTPRCFGLSTETVHAFLQQKEKWAFGGAHIIKSYFRHHNTTKNRMDFFQKVGYLFSALHPTIGIVCILITINPIMLYHFPANRSFSSDLHYLAFQLSILLVPLTFLSKDLKNKGFKRRNVAKGYLLLYLSSFIQIKSFFKCFFFKIMAFPVTPKDKIVDNLLNYKLIFGSLVFLHAYIIIVLSIQIYESFDLAKFVNFLSVNYNIILLIGAITYLVYPQEKNV